MIWPVGLGRTTWRRRVTIMCQVYCVANTMFYRQLLEAKQASLRLRLTASSVHGKARSLRRQSGEAVINTHVVLGCAPYCIAPSSVRTMPFELIRTRLAVACIYVRCRRSRLMAASFGLFAAGVEPSLTCLLPRTMPAACPLARHRQRACALFPLTQQATTVVLAPPRIVDAHVREVQGHGWA